MSDELQGVLAELASGLGTTSGELWAWLQSDGIAEYAKVKVAQLGVEVAGFGLATLACIVLAVLMVRGLARCKNSWDEDGWVFGIVTSACGAVVFAVSFFMAASELAGWLASPQGMVISTLLEKLW